MKHMVELGLKNPIWLVVKSFFEEVAKSIELYNLEFSSVNGKIFINHPLKYQEYHALIQAIGHSRVID